MKQTSWTQNFSAIHALCTEMGCAPSRLRQTRFVTSCACWHHLMIGHNCGGLIERCQFNRIGPAAWRTMLGVLGGVDEGYHEVGGPIASRRCSCQWLKDSQRTFSSARWLNEQYRQRHRTFDGPPCLHQAPTTFVIRASRGARALLRTQGAVRSEVFLEAPRALRTSIKFHRRHGRPSEEVRDVLTTFAQRGHGVYDILTFIKPMPGGIFGPAQSDLIVDGYRLRQDPNFLQRHPWEDGPRRMQPPRLVEEDGEQRESLLRPWMEFGRLCSIR